MSVAYKNENKNRTNLKKYIETIAQKEEFLKYECDIHKVQNDGTNLCGELIQVGIRGETTHGIKKINIFVKLKITDGKYSNFLPIADMFLRELYAYKELSDIYGQLQEEANIPFEDRYKFVKHYDESNADMIILEDIAKLGYVTCDRYEIISIDFAQKCITQLAKFHALSFVLEKKNSDYFNCNLKHLKYHVINNKELATFLNNTFEICLNHLEGDRKVKLTSVRDICKKYHYFVTSTSGVRCLCHGDYRTLNLMMKYTNGEISDAITLDYQSLYYGLPDVDFWYFIFGSTDREFRQQHLENLKYLYYDTMKDFLKYFEMDINLYYPKKEFFKEHNESLEFGLMVSVWFLPLILLENIENSNETSKGEANFGINKILKARLEDLIDDCTEFGVFKRNAITGSETTVGNV